MRRILWKLFELAPTPEIAMNADPEAVEAVIYPLGLYKKRALMFKRFSREYLQKEVAFSHYIPPKLQAHALTNS